MSAPFLRDKWKWIDTGQCWWCDSKEISREHLFKECAHWKKEIRQLWTEVGEASGKRHEDQARFKSGKGFGYGVKSARARPSNASIREFLSSDMYTEAALSFLRTTRVGKVKEGVIFSSVHSQVVE